MSHDYSIPQISWQEGSVIQVGNPADFWHMPIQLLRQQFEDHQAIDLGSCDHQTWYYSIMGHGSASGCRSRRRRVFQGEVSLARQAVCGPIRRFDGQSASISWSMTIVQLSVEDNQACTIVRQVNCRLTAMVRPVHDSGNQVVGQRLSYRLQTKSRQPLARYYSTKSQAPQLAHQLTH